MWLTCVSTMPVKQTTGKIEGRLRKPTKEGERGVGVSDFVSPAPRI